MNYDYICCERIKNSRHFYQCTAVLLKTKNFATMKNKKRTFKKEVIYISVFVPHEVERSHYESLAFAWVKFSKALQHTRLIKTDLLDTAEGLIITAFLS